MTLAIAQQQDSKEDEPMPGMRDHDPWQRWPLTLEALQSTYYADKRMPEAYLLSALQRMFQRACEVHGAPRVDYRKLDAAASQELYYHHTRGRTFRNTEAALSTCWRNIVTERPDRILAPAETRRQAPSQGASRIAHLI